MWVVVVRDVRGATTVYGRYTKQEWAAGLASRIRAQLATLPGRQGDFTPEAFATKLELPNPGAANAARMATER